MTTFPDVLTRLLSHDPGRPLVTFYDGRSGERTELSVATWANWVAKVSSLLADGLDVEHGSRLLVELPTHWLGTVVLGAAWACGIEVVSDGDSEIDAVVTGPDGVERWATEAERIPVLASALQPLAGPFPDGVPPGVHDLGTEVWSQPDSYVAWPGPAPDDLAVAGATHAEVFGADGGQTANVGERLLSQANPASAAGLACLTGPLALDGSLVLVVNAEGDRLDQIAASERVTRRFTADRS